MPEIELVAHNPGWATAYQQERQLLLDRLFAVQGPLLMDHIGSTAIRDIAAKAVIDIMVGLTRPLSSAGIAVMQELGYQYHGEMGVPGREFFKREPRTHHVHLVHLGHDLGFWWEHLLFRDYLRAFPEAARRYETVKLDLARRFPNDRPSYTSSKSPIIHELMHEAEHWEKNFGPVLQVQKALQNAPFHWMIAGGWALDLHLGSGQRHHEDIDVLVYLNEQHRVQQFLQQQGWSLQRIEKGQFFPWLPGETILFPHHQAHATHPDFPSIDLLFDGGGPDQWVYRRNPAVTHPAAQGVGPHQVPYLMPEVVLLYKGTSSVGIRSKDQQDLQRILPVLTCQQQKWLQSQLMDPHPWRPLLEDL